MTLVGYYSSFWTAILVVTATLFFTQAPLIVEAQASDGGGAALDPPDLGSGGSNTGATPSGTLRDLIVSRPELTQFKDMLDKVGLLNGILDDESQTITVLAPNDEALKENPFISKYQEGMNELPLPRWNNHLLETCYNHMIDNQELTRNDIFDGARTSIVSMHNTWDVSQFSKTVGSTAATLDTIDLYASNGILHILQGMIEPQFYRETFKDLELQTEFGPDHLQRISMVDVVDNIPGARQMLGTSRDSGLTYAGCRIRAFNRMGLDYLPQTINGGMFVKEHELMNQSFVNESLKNFIEYQLVPTNYYLDHVEKNYEELVLPVGKCSHMWITNRFGKFCFNDGCVVETPDPRTFLASNGVGYVLDRCVICSGVAMLTDYAAEFSSLNMRDVAQLFWGTEWNLRNLSLSVGDGGPVTLFAPFNKNFDFFTLEDTTRLSTDKWRRHLWDLCKHFLVQGKYLEADLRNITMQNGGQDWEMTMLTGENVTIGFDTEANALTVEGGPIVLPNIKGQDGFAHFIEQVPQPRSVTKNCFTIVEDDPDNRFRIQLGYLTTMFLEEDVKRLLPLTMFYAPNELWEGKLINLLELSETVLENMIFKELLWCERLIELAENNEPVESHNGRLWELTINEEGAPCFKTIQDLEANTNMYACVSKCDILARNGLVHEIDNIMVYQSLETLAPFPPVAPFTPTAPSPVFTRPQPVQEPSFSGNPGSTSSAQAMPGTVGWWMVATGLFGMILGR